MFSQVQFDDRMITILSFYFSLQEHYAQMKPMSCRPPFPSVFRAFYSSRSSGNKYWIIRWLITPGKIWKWPGRWIGADSGQDWRDSTTILLESWKPMLPKSCSPADFPDITADPAYMCIVHLIQGVRGELIGNPELQQPYFEVLRSVYEGKEVEDEEVDVDVDTGEEEHEIGKEEVDVDAREEADLENKIKKIKGRRPTAHHVTTFFNRHFPPIRFRDLTQSRAWGMHKDREDRRRMIIEQSLVESTVACQVRRHSRRLIYIHILTVMSLSFRIQEKLAGLKHSSSSLFSTNLRIDSFLGGLKDASIPHPTSWVAPNWEMLWTHLRTVTALRNRI